MSEHDDQVALFQWAALQSQVYPGLELMFAIPNGGLRNIKVAIKMKAEGLKPGVPDIFLPVSMGGYHGLFIEMKYKSNKPRENQVAYIDALTAEGYCTAVCWGCKDAIETIIDYYDMDGGE